MNTPLAASALCLALSFGLVAAPQTTLGDAQTEYTASADATALELQAFRHAARQAARETIAHWRQVLDSPDPDLRAEIAATQSQVDAFIAEFRTLRDARLNWYESLPAQQQAVARAHLQARLERVERLLNLIDALAPATASR